MSIKLLFVTMLLVVLVPASTSAQDDEKLNIEVNLVDYEENPLLSMGEDGSWNDESLYFPHVVFHDGMYHMFYSARSEPRGVPSTTIGYATSEDGLTWTEYENNPIMGGDGSGFDSGEAMRAYVMVDENGLWTMYYRGQSEDLEDEGIGIATAASPTGDWTRLDDPILTKGAEGEWDSDFLYVDSVLHTDDGYVMYYSGASSRGVMIGMATSSDGLAWEKYDDPSTESEFFASSDPVLKKGDISSWERSTVWMARVYQVEDGWEMFYSGFDGNKTSIGYAFSEDRIHWRKAEQNPIIHSDTDRLLDFPTAVYMGDGTYRIYYVRNTETINLTIGTIERLD